MMSSSLFKIIAIDPVNLIGKTVHIYDASKSKWRVCRIVSIDPSSIGVIESSSSLAKKLGVKQPFKAQIPIRVGQTLESTIDQLDAHHTIETQLYAECTPGAKLFFDFLLGNEVVCHHRPEAKVTRNQLFAWPKESRTSGEHRDLNWEKYHGFIQFLFPTMGLGADQGKAKLEPSDVAAIKQHPSTYRYVQNCLKEHLQHYLEYLGVTIKFENGLLRIQKFDETKFRATAEIGHGHNQARVTRVMTSLAEFGLTDLARATFKTLNRYVVSLGLRANPFWKDEIDRIVIGSEFQSILDRFPPTERRLLEFVFNVPLFTIHNPVYNTECRVARDEFLKHLRQFQGRPLKESPVNGGVFRGVRALLFPTFLIDTIKTHPKLFRFVQDRIFDQIMTYLNYIGVHCSPELELSVGDQDRFFEAVKSQRHTGEISEVIAALRLTAMGDIADRFEALMTDRQGNANA